MARSPQQLELLRMLFRRQMESNDALSQLTNKYAGGEHYRSTDQDVIDQDVMGRPRSGSMELEPVPPGPPMPAPEKVSTGEPKALMSRTKVEPLARGATFVEGMVKRGWTPAEAAGAAGNVHVESGFQPEIKSKAPGENSYGYLQWNHKRLEGLQNMAQATGRDWLDPEVQMDYIHMERTGESVKYGGDDERTNYKRALAGGGTPAQIAERFGQFVERPQDLSKSVATRRAAAERYASTIGQSYANEDNQSLARVWGG